MLPLFLLIHGMASRGRIFYRNTRPKKSFKTELGNGSCRTCGSSRSLGSLFSGGESKEIISEQLRLVTGLVIRPNDGFSQYICRRCYRAVRTAIRLRRVSRKTEKLRLSMRVKTENVPKLAMTTVVKTEPQTDSLQANEFGQMGFIDRYQNYNFPDLYDICKKEAEDTKPLGTTSDSAPYKCRTCGQAFSSREVYDAHRKTHKNVWVCEECGKCCRSNFELKNHKRAKHGMERIHKCSYCDYSPATQEALTIHERRHTGERPYVCDHCGAAFYRRNTLVQHLALHLPDNKYQCDLCPKRFKSKNFLLIHKHDTHTGKRYGYLCSVCERRFQKPYKVREHARKAHGLGEEEQAPVVRIEL